MNINRLPEFSRIPVDFSNGAANGFYFNSKKMLNPLLLLLLFDLFKRRVTLKKYSLKNNFRQMGCFHLLPEFEVAVSGDGGVRHIRLAFLTHELWITLNKE